MARRRRKSHHHAADIFGLAPVVIALRMPTLAAEAFSHASPRPETTRAWSEKVAAATEGAMAAQTAFAAAAMKTWFGMLGGTLEPKALAAAQEAAALAALAPVSRRVRANVRRLSR